MGEEDASSSNFIMSRPESMLSIAEFGSQSKSSGLFKNRFSDAADKDKEVQCAMMRMR